MAAAERYARAASDCDLPWENDGGHHSAELEFAKAELFRAARDPGIARCHLRMLAAEFDVRAAEPDRGRG